MPVHQEPPYALAAVKAAVRHQAEAISGSAARLCVAQSGGPELWGEAADAAGYLNWGAAVQPQMVGAVRLRRVLQERLSAMMTAAALAAEPAVAAVGPEWACSLQPKAMQYWRQRLVSRGKPMAAESRSQPRSADVAV